MNALVSLPVGHRSIVNNVVWHPTEPIMAACGVEKYIRRAQKLSSDLTLTVEPAFDLIPIYIYIIPTVWSPFRMGGPEDSWVPQRQRKAGSIDRGIDPFGVNDEIEQRSTQESTETLSLFDLLLHIDKVRGNRTSSDGESEQRIDSNSSEAHSPEHSSNADEVDQVGVARRLGSRWCVLKLLSVFARRVGHLKRTGFLDKVTIYCKRRHGLG